MYIYKLNYSNKESAIADLLIKGVYIKHAEELLYGLGIQAIVEIGKIILQKGTYDEQGNVITEPIFVDGYHYDVMSENVFDFGLNEIKVNSPKHTFLGY